LESKRHPLSLEFPKQAITLEADPVRLAQVLSNQLINAGKYTDPGGHIALHATLQGNDVIISVRDMSGYQTCPGTTGSQDSRRALGRPRYGNWNEE
jgi:signal transduction histidine kinase